MENALFKCESCEKEYEDDCMNDYGEHYVCDSCHDELEAFDF